MTGSHKHGHGHDHRHAHRQSHTSERIEVTFSPEKTALENLERDEASSSQDTGTSRRKGSRKKS
jgi:hypothetical protein